MKWCSALSRETNLDLAVKQVSDSILNGLQQAPDLAFVFASDHFQSEFDQLPKKLGLLLQPKHLVGGSASGVIGARSEVEFEPALTVLAASLPDVSIDCWHLEETDLAPGTEHSERCAQLAAGNPGQLIVLCDPFSFPAEQLLRSLETAFSSSTIAGGLVSGGRAAGETALFVDQACFREGATMLALSGNVEMVTAVAQGCRPIGEPMFATRIEHNCLQGVDDKAPVEVLNELYQNASDHDKQLMQHSLFVGIAMRGGESTYSQGDYLIRNVMGADQESGAIWIGAALQENQIVQFHLRDADTSAQDLTQVLTRLNQQLGEQSAEGALLFSCTGRGRGLYGKSDHDSLCFTQTLGDLPLGGFFCNGEIGPVAGTTFVHGYTSAFAVFRPKVDRP